MEDVAEYVDRIVVMNQGRVAFNGEPREVFRHYRELEQMGLSAPQVTYVMHQCREAGLDTAVDLITIEEAKKELLRVFADRRQA